MNSKIEERKIIFLGSEGVGKTCLINRLVVDEFTDNEPQTVGGQYVSKEITTNQRKVVLHLYDTAGQERFENNIPKPFYQESQIAFICFDFDEEKSLNVDKYINKLMDENPNCIVFLVATKFDKYGEKQLEISEFMTNITQKFDCIKGNFYTSALSGFGVADVFKKAADINVFHFETSQQVKLDDDPQEVNNKPEKKGCCS